MDLSIPELDRKLPGHSVTSATKTPSRIRAGAIGPERANKSATFIFAPNNRNAVLYQVDSSLFRLT
jgi:hypothetical protein